MVIRTDNIRDRALGKRGWQPSRSFEFGMTNHSAEAKILTPFDAAMDHPTPHT